MILHVHMNNLNISHPVVLVPIETIESANESGNCNVFQEGVTCTVCARLNSGRMGELRAPFEVLQAIIFVHFYYSNSMRFFCTHRIGWYVVSEVYTLWDNCRSDQNTQLISPPPSGKQLRLHGDHMEKLAAIVVWVGRAVLNNRSECPVPDKRLPNHSEDLRRKLCEVRM
jgi:hypothetical protein